MEMKASFLRYLAVTLFTGATLLIPYGSATASSYPDKPVKIVVGYPPGGLADNLARLLADGLSSHYKQTFIVENKAGASGTIATAQVARAEPDGYTIFLGDTTLSSVSMKKSLTYDPINDFEAVRLMVQVPTVLVVNKDFPPKNVSELVKAAKENPGKFNYASYGVATSSNLNSVLLKKEAGIELEHIGYKGSAPAMIGLRAGDVQMMFDTAASAYPQIKAGEVRPLMVSSAKRLPLLPDVPTSAEAGVPGVKITSWMGVLAPKGTEPAIVESLSNAVKQVLEKPETAKKLNDFGLIVGDSGGKEYQELIEREIARTQKTVDDAGIQFE